MRSMKAACYLLIPVALVLAASACSTTVKGKKIDYEATRTLPPLEIPPDLSSLPPDSQTSRTGTTGGAATYSRYEAEQKRGPGGAADTAVLPEYAGIRLERAAAQRWLVVDANAEQLWPQMRDFLDKMGLAIAKEDPQIGLVETNWAENRANVGSPAQRFFSKLTGKGYGTGLRDKYRIRLERGRVPGTTEVYLTHLGLVEAVAQSEYSRDYSGLELEGTTIWQPRPSDPELQAEMLRRLMVHLGVRAEAAHVAMQGAGASSARAELSRANGVPALTLADQLEVAWRRVGISLDTVGYIVEDEDRANHIYFVRAIDQESAKKKKKEPQRYQVALRETTTGTAVRILDVNGKPSSGPESEKILGLLYEQLR